MSGFYPNALIFLYYVNLQILLNLGAEIERKNEHEQTPLHLAAKNGHIK